MYYPYNLLMRQPGLGKLEWISEEKKKAKAMVKNVGKEEKEVRGSKIKK